MTTKLGKAVSEIEHLPEDEQDAIADWLLAELESERRWDNLFARSSGLLGKMAGEALSEHRAGRTLELDPDKP
ncbi:MAG: hypothetical protein ACRD16_16355 [Thermoanaerobaculia bacterium]